MMRVALAGPVSNLIIAFIANFIYQLVNFILIALNVQTKTGLLFFWQILFAILFTFYSGEHFFGLV